MTAEAKFEVYNNENKLVINESFKNLYLSRKVAGNTLPLEYISKDNGSYVYGSYLARRIDFLPERDEVFAAVAAPVGQSCNFFIFNNVANLGSKAYLCAAQRYYPNEYVSTATYCWNDPDRVFETGMSDTRVVPDGIDVFIFAKSDKDTSSPTGKKQTTDTVGLQVFNASGDCVYDSRFKSAKIVGMSGAGVYWVTTKSDRRVAIGTVWAGSGSCPIYREYAPGRKTLDHYEIVIWGFGSIIKHYELPPTYDYHAISVGMALTGSMTERTGEPFMNPNEYGYMMFDVTNF